MISNFEKKRFWLKTASNFVVNKHRRADSYALVLNKLNVKFYNAYKLFCSFEDTMHYYIFCSIFYADVFFELNLKLNATGGVFFFNFNDLRLLLDTELGLKYRALADFFDNNNLFCLKANDFGDYLLLLRKLFELELNSAFGVNVLLTKERDCFISFRPSLTAKSIRELYSMEMAGERVLVEFCFLINLPVSNLNELLFKSYSTGLSIFTPGLGYAIFFN